MRRIFLTSGLVLCLACPAFADIAAGTSSTSCTESVLGSTTGPVDFSSDWRPMISGAITLDPDRYTSNSGSAVSHATTAADPDTLNAVYGVGVYASAPSVSTLSDFTTSNRMTALTSTPTMTGYNFAGFYTTKATGGTQVISANGSIIYPDASTQVTTENAGAVWYARWTPTPHTITFASGDAHNSNNNNSGHQTPTHNNDNVSTTFTWNISYGNSLAMPENDWNTPRGYTFGGWSSPYNLVSGQQTTTTYSNGENISAYNVNQDITITALWDPINYTISYNTGRAGSRTSGFSGTMNSTSVDFDDAVTLRTNSYSIPGYTFNGWRGNYDNTNGLASIINSPYQTGGTVYTNSQSLSKYNIADNLILYAQWTPNNYTVTYNAGLHGSGTAASYTGVANGGLTYDSTWTTKTFAQTGLSAASGYSFSKWNTAQDGSGIDYTAGTAQSAWTTAGNLTLYAIYTANARPITYSCGSGSCGTPPSNGSANYGQSYNLSSTYGSCAKEGHHATGWDCSGGATLTNATGSQNANTWSSDATISCSVHWVANTVNLNYYQDTNANSTFTTGTCNYGSTFNLPSSNLPTKPGYHINGWNIRGNGSASACAGQAMNCDTLQNLDTGGFSDQEHYFAIGYASGADDCFSSDFGGVGDPSACSSDSRFSDLTTYGWKVESGSGHWLYGTSKCSAHVGHHDDWWDSADSQYWSATTSQLTSAGDGKYCWCKAIGYNTDGESSLCNTESPAWIFVEERADTPACADTCAQICAEAVRAPGGSVPDYDVFRSLLHGVQ